MRVHAEQTRFASVSGSEWIFRLETHRGQKLRDFLLTEKQIFQFISAHFLSRYQTVSVFDLILNNSCASNLFEEA